MQEAQDPSKFDIEHISDDDEDGDISPSHNEASSETSSFVQIFDSKDAKEQEKSMSKPHIEMNLTMLFDVLQEPSDLSITERVENFMKDLVGDKKEQSSSSKPKISLHSP